jgi:8-oxo-dGTP pyrophosphatase MutT (NUDIX family)
MKGQVHQKKSPFDSAVTEKRPRDLKSNILVDTSEDYRSFVFSIHPEHGLLLLKSREKKRKGSYWEIPGGHLEDEDFEAAAAIVSDTEASQLQMAGKIGARRELMEECGFDIGDDLSRLELAVFASDEEQTNSLASLHNLYKGRLFYFLRLEDSDFLSDGEGGVAPSSSEGSNLRVSWHVSY